MGNVVTNTLKRGKTEKVGNAVDRYIKKDRNTPVLSNAVAPVGDVASGVGKVLSGDVKGGAKGIGKSMLSAIPGQSLGAWNTPPDPTYLGGSPEALAELRNKYEAGRAAGAGVTGGGIATADQGVTMLGDASAQAGQDRQHALGAARGGAAILGNSLIDQQAAIGRQNDVTRQMLATAGQQGPSAAQAQMRMGLEQSQRAMMAQAAGARGGNAAAAMQMAQANGSAMAGQVNQQAAVLRAQEQQAHQTQLLNAQNAAAGTYGGQGTTFGNTAGLGANVQNQGLQLAQGSTGQQGQFGANTASAGLGEAQAGNQMQATYLGNETEANKAQLDADEKQESAKQGAKGGIIGAAKNIIGSIF